MDAKIQSEKREGGKCETEIIFQVPVFQRQRDNCLPESGSLFLKGYLPAGHRSEITGRMLILVFAGVLVPDSSDQSSHRGLKLLQTVLGTVSNYYIKLAQIWPCSLGSSPAQEVWNEKDGLDVTEGKHQIPAFIVCMSANQHVVNT